MFENDDAAVYADYTDGFTDGYRQLVDELLGIMKRCQSERIHFDQVLISAARVALNSRWGDEFAGTEVIPEVSGFKVSHGYMFPMTTNVVRCWESGEALSKVSNDEIRTFIENTISGESHWEAFEEHISNAMGGLAKGRERGPEPGQVFPTNG
jgi:hypothetical protein